MDGRIVLAIVLLIILVTFAIWRAHQNKRGWPRQVENMHRLDEARRRARGEAWIEIDLKDVRPTETR